MELGGAVIFVKDLKRMMAFYGGALGLSLLDDQSGEGWAEFATGGASLLLHAIPPGLAAEISITDPPRTREESATKLLFRVTDVEAERARLVSHGVRMLELRAWGACDGVDPEGNVFQIARVPSSPRGPKPGGGSNVGA